MTFDLDDNDYLYLQILENRGQVTMSNEDEILAHLRENLMEDRGIQETMHEFDHACDHEDCPVCMLQGAIEVINELGMGLAHDEANGLGASLTGNQVCQIQSAVLFLAVVTDGFIHSVMEVEDPENEE